MTVTNPDGQSGSLASAFHLPGPANGEQCVTQQWIDSGGTAVTITGTNFAAGATVTFGVRARPTWWSSIARQSLRRRPAGSAGAVTVTVKVSGQSGSLANGYTYVVIPTVSSVAPNNGPTAGGTAVTITGTNFAAGATVTFGGAAATNVVVVNSTTITAATPARECGSGRCNGDGEWSERKPGQWVHLRCAADGEGACRQIAGRRGWYGGDDHGHELRGRSDGDIRRRGGDQCGGGEQHHDHGEDAGGKCRAQ